MFFLFVSPSSSFYFFFFNDTATTEIYTLSLHDALPISTGCCVANVRGRNSASCVTGASRFQGQTSWQISQRSEEHTSELQSRLHLVCRLLLEKKKKKQIRRHERKHECEKR